MDGLRNNLELEWTRLELLAECVSDARAGRAYSSSRQQQLEQLQGQVMALRQQQPWQKMIAEHQLTPLDQDILACSLAPETHPHLGWMYSQLQPAHSPYPSPALIQELLFIPAAESHLLQQRLQPSAPLLRYGLLADATPQRYQPLHTSARAQQGLLEYQHTGMDLPGAVRLKATGSWSDLVLPANSLARLREYMLWLTHRQQVEQEWGGEIIGGPVALFSGPSGTGKTYAASVIANELGWPLYRVDLGMLVSKYVGETEKNLNQLLDAAHGQNLVLLFDEADALFGRRAEVKDARDRYANMEVSHLLSRIERHHGPCILTSNFRQNLDPAFARRFQMVVEFARPDASARLALWNQHIPCRAPRSDSLDLALVANSVALTGGQIRNVALHAAFLAAERQQPISTGLLTQGIWTEFAKEGREMVASRLGDLQSYLNPPADVPGAREAVL
ncbi:ATP-binding protein [Bacterioplanoides sp.]|uniref:ATP-binding protein n=1 Tax=Bacterioplanoides sp. TaxID=2066072 RepID=UPI003B00C13F